VNYAH